MEAAAAHAANRASGGEAQPAAAAAAAAGCPVAHLLLSGQPRASSTSGSTGERRRVSFQADEVVPGEKLPTPKSNLKHSNDVAMKKIVDDLYRRVLSDERLAPFYEHINMVRLKNQQEKVMMMIFGGQELMEEFAPTLDLRSIHIKAIATQGLNTDHWKWFVDHLAETLESMPEIPADTRKSAMCFIQTTKDMFKPLDEKEKEQWAREHPDQLAH